MGFALDLLVVDLEHGSPDSKLLETAKRYQQLLELYKDSETVWRKEIEKPILDFDTDKIVVKYGLKGMAYPRGATALSRARPGSIDYPEIRQELWSRAAKIQDALTVNYYGR
jgi:hypothetical protein